MGYKTYTRADMTTEVADYFSINETATNQARIHSSLDRAIQRVIRARPAWHFLERPLAIDVLGSENVTVTFSQGNRSATVSINAPAVGYTDFIGHVIADEDTDYISNGYLVVDHTIGSGNITLAAAYRGTSGAKTCTITKAYFPLPSDFLRICNLYDLELVDRKLAYLTPADFEYQLRQRYTQVIGADYFTVIPDFQPEDTPQTTARLPRLGVFPFIMDRTTLQGKYYVQHQALADDTDVPILPLEFRQVIIDLACYYTATQLGYEGSKMDNIRIEALTSLKNMLEHYNYSSADTEPPRGMNFGPLHFDNVQGSPSQGDLFYE